MILKKIGRALGISQALKVVRKALGWILNIPKPEDPRGMEIKREGSDHALPVVYGERMVGGIVVHDWVTDSITGMPGIEHHNRKNAYLHQIIAFCHGPVHSIDALYFNGEHENAQQYRGKYAAYRMNGSDTQNAIPDAVNNIGNWNANMRGRNVAYVYLVLYQDENQTIWRGEPEVQAVIRGRTLHDPRTGAISYSDNPALAALDYLLNPIYGRGLNANRIDMAAFAAAADFCDEGTSSTVSYTICEPSDQFDDFRPVCRQETRTINSPRYRIDAILSTDATVFDNYRELLQVFRAYPRRPNGLVSLHVETVAPESFPVFDETELVGKIRYQFGGQRGRYNRFKIRFPNKLNRYERDEFTYPPKDNPLFQQWLDEDNGKELLGELELNTISETSYAAQNAEIAAKASRLSGVMAATLPPRARLLEPGDIIGINSDLYGWTAKPFRIQKIAETTTGAFEVELREHEDAVYTWSGSSWDEQVGGSWLGNPAQPDAPTNLQIFPDPTLATSGRLTWQSVNDAFVREYEVVISQGGDAVFDNRTRGTAFDLPLLDVGEYTVQVFSITTLGYRSAPASILLELVVPVAPTDLGLSASNNAITSEPVLAGAGLGTTFEFDIDDLSDSGFEPEPRLRGRSAVFTGRIPETEYRVWARTINALGVSEWVNDTITTTADIAEQAPVFQRLLEESPVIEEVVTELNERVNAGRQRVADARVNVAEEVSKVYELARERLARETGFIEVREDLSTETEQRALQINGVVATLDDEVAERQASILQVNEAIVTESEARATQFNNLNAAISDETSARESAITQVNQSIADEAGIRASAISAISGRLDTAEGNISGNSTLIQNVTLELGGVQTVVSGLQSSFTQLDQDLSSVSDLILASGLDAQGNTTATAALDARLEDAEGEIAAQAGLIADVEQTANGNTSAIAALDTRVSDGEQFAAAQLILNSEFDSGLGTLSARAFLGTDVNGRVTGIVINDDGQQRVIELAGDVIRFLRANGTSAIVYDTSINEFVFDGRVTAETVQGVDLIGNSIRVGNATIAQNNNTGFFTHVDSTPFGTTNDLAEWYGEKVNGVTWTNSTGQPRPQGMSKLNAKTYKTVDGSVFFGGTFQAGVLSIARQATNSSGTLVVNSDPFTIPAGVTSLSLTASLNIGGRGIGVGSACPTGLPSYTLTVDIERLDGSTWTSIAGNSTSIPVTCNFLGGGEFELILSGGPTVNTQLGVTGGQSVTLRAVATAVAFPTTINGVEVTGTRSLSIAVSGA